MGEGAARSGVWGMLGARVQGDVMVDDERTADWMRRRLRPRGVEFEERGTPAADGEGDPGSARSVSESAPEGASETVFREGAEVDPDRCRVWGVNTRAYDLLTEQSCRGLLDSIVQHKGLVQPVLVRPVKDDPAADYEVVFGVRRLWCVKLLRQRGYADIALRATVVEGLKDEEAFLMCDTENREREDFSPIERARMYAQAVEKVYAGKAAVLADSVGLSERRVKAFLAVAALPESLVAAFGDPRVVSMKAWTQVVALLNSDRRRTLRAAEKAAAEQRELEAEGKRFLTVREVLMRLRRSPDQVRGAPVRVKPLYGKSGYELLRGKYDPVAGWALTIHPGVEGVPVEELIDAFSRVIAAHWPGSE